MIVETFPIDDPAWDQALSGLDHDMYHTRTYVELDSTQVGAEPRAAVVRDGSRTLFLPYLVREDQVVPGGATVRDVVSPYGYPGAVTDCPGDDEFTVDAFAALRARFRDEGACTAFVRGNPMVGPDLHDLAIPGATTLRTPTVLVDLTVTEKEFWTSTRKGHQSTINKCIRQGQAFRVVGFDECEADFLEIYRLTMEHVSATSSYFFDRSYFERLAESPHTHLAVVEIEGRVAAACLVFETCGVVQAHLGGTHPDFRAESPFTLLIHEVRRWGKERGNRIMNLGGGVSGAEDSVLRFKAGYSRLRGEFETTRIVVDEQRHDELVRQRADHLGVPADLLLATDWFPAYRAARPVASTV